MNNLGHGDDDGDDDGDDVADDNGGDDGDDDGDDDNEYAWIGCFFPFGLEAGEKLKEKSKGCVMRKRIT